MSNHLSSEVWLIGAGQMAVEYAKVLLAQNVSFSSIGRNEERCRRFADATGCAICRGGVQAALSACADGPEHAIVAVNIEELANVTIALLERGTKSVLLEKPAGLDRADIQRVADAASRYHANVYVAYNRRFYASTLAAQKMILEDGGVDAFQFEFTEWSHQIVTLSKTVTELNSWLLANSTHVIDLAFYLCGEPTHMSCNTRGKLNWRPSAAAFSGSGLSASGAIFSYLSDWRAPGRWALEALTQKHRYIFKPMERLQLQDIGSVRTYEAEVDYSLDEAYKPGLYRQVDAYLHSNHDAMLDIHGQLAHMEYYELIERGGVM